MDLFAGDDFCGCVSIAGKGVGVVAKAFIPAGQIIVQDQHILLIDGKELGLSDLWSQSNKPADVYDRKHALIRKKFEQLSEGDQAKAASLHDRSISSYMLLRMRAGVLR